MILGLSTTESYANDRWTNYRSAVFYSYPNGKFPLAGLLSMLAGGKVREPEESNDPEFSWNEDRYAEYSSTSASQGSSKGPFMRSDGSTDAADPVDDGSANGWKEGTVYSIKVASTAYFRVGHMIRMNVNCNGAASTFELRATITEITSSTVIKVRALNSKAQSGGIDNGATNENVGKVVLVIGHSAAQGATISGNEITPTPVNFGNYCGIQRTHFRLTGTAFKTSLKYDKTGPYTTKSKKALLEHMTGLERSLLFGVKTKYLDGSSIPTYTSAGVMAFLQAYEAANSDYRGGSGASAITSDSDENKRIIENIGGYLTEALMDMYIERVFRNTQSPTSEKLCICGNQALMNVNQLYRSKGVLQYRPGGSKETFGMEVVSHLTPFGTIHYKTHPLFNMNAEMRSWMLILDIWNLKYRFIEGRDTQVLKNRQAPDADQRMDEWLSECGLELQFPESHMLIKNVTSWRP